MRTKGNLQIMEQTDIIGQTSEFARVFGIEFYHVLSRGSQVSKSVKVFCWNKTFTKCYKEHISAFLPHATQCRIVVSVPRRVDDAASREAAQLHRGVAGRAAAREAARAGVHSAHARAAVALLLAPGRRARLSVALPVHHDRLQLLLLHLCGQDGAPQQSKVSTVCLMLILSNLLCKKERHQIFYTAPCVCSLSARVRLSSDAHLFRSRQNCSR